VTLENTGLFWRQHKTQNTTHTDTTTNKMSRTTLPIIFIFCFLLSVRVSGFTNLSIGDTQEHQLDIYPEKDLLCFNILNYMP